MSIAWNPTRMHDCCITENEMKRIKESLFREGENVSQKSY